MQVFLCQKLNLINEMYFAIALDRASAGPVSAPSHMKFVFSPQPVRFLGEDISGTES